MAPAASILSAAAAAATKRPAASDADPPQGDGKKEEQPECPRCGSGNTKFCYYNNYSTAQPRHFCRACRRYWTKGGTLRDVPVGGASRRSGGGGGSKRRRVSADHSSASASPPATTTHAEDALYPDLPAAFPFLADGVFLPQLDLGVVAPEAFSWPAAAPEELYVNGPAPWDDGARGTGVAGVWDSFRDIIGLSWPPPPPADN